MSHTGPPPRWRNCPRRGQPVAGKFLPMKTMLGPRYDDQVAEENRFHPSMLSNYLKSLKVKMGLLVDLTNTTRFYDRNDIEKEGIKYWKLQCKGHGECPGKETTSVFISFCERFMEKNPTELIGVHCTHGFNRTGFLICAYLVEKMDWSIEAAVAAFAQARAPGIYKGDYLKELFRRYGDEEDAPPAPTLPEWCFDDDDGDVDDDGNAVGQDSGPSSSGLAPGKRKKEKLKLGAVFLEGITVRGVTQVTSQPKLGDIQRMCQEMAEWEKSGFPGAQPVSMDRQNLHFLEQNPYKVSWKADGTRISNPPGIFWQRRAVLPIDAPLMMCKAAGSSGEEHLPPPGARLLSVMPQGRAGTMAVCTSLGLKCLEDRDKDKIRESQHPSEDGSRQGGKHTCE